MNVLELALGKVSTVFVIAVVLALSVNVWRAAADEECDTWCHEGNCWKIDNICVKTPTTSARHTSTTWSKTGGGTFVYVGSILAKKRAYCTKECLDKSKSRAMEPPYWSETTCGGMETGDYAWADGFCGSTS